MSLTKFLVKVLLPMSLFLSLFLTGILEGQEPEEETQVNQKKAPTAFDFSKMFQTEKLTRSEWEQLKRQKEIELREKMARQEALETPIDPDVYVIGPGDGFSFNVWGGIEIQVPVIVTPEGKVALPSVGEVHVAGMTLSEVNNMVIELAKPSYDKSEVSLTLLSLRFFRVHVVGEVNYPGTYIAQAVDRLSEVIAEAGGMTDRAWQRMIELRRAGVKQSHYFDLLAFEHEGDLEQNPYVTGGDVILVPGVDLKENTVHIEGNLDFSGVYQIVTGETLLNFLQINRVLKRDTDLDHVRVLRYVKSGSGSAPHLYSPFQDGGSEEMPFRLQSGDRVILPVEYVYVKGSVLNPGTYPFVQNLKAKDYAGMAGGDFRSGDIVNVKVFHHRTGRSEKGHDAPVEPGDIIHLQTNWALRYDPYIRIVLTAATLVLTAKAAGLFNK